MVRNLPDLVGGALLIALAATALYFLGPLPFGTAARPGAAFLPTLVAVLIAILGAAVLARGLFGGADRIESGRIRPFAAVLGAIAMFALLIERAGLPVAVLAAVLVAAMAQPRLLDWRSLLFAVLLAAACTATFRYALNIPFRLLP
jgi:hypothetical protein